MKSVLVCLNTMVERGMHTEVTREDARLALHAIETQELAVAALRTLADNPQSHEALAHARRFLHLHDSYQAKHTVGPTVLAGATSEQKQDVSDLV